MSYLSLVTRNAIDSNHVQNTGSKTSMANGMSLSPRHSGAKMRKRKRKQGERLSKRPTQLLGPLFGIKIGNAQRIPGIRRSASPSGRILRLTVPPGTRSHREGPSRAKVRVGIKTLGGIGTGSYCVIVLL